MRRTVNNWGKEEWIIALAIAVILAILYYF